MTARTFKLYGHTYKSNDPVTIMAKIDGSEVFNGPVESNTLGNSWFPAHMITVPGYDINTTESVGGITLPEGGYELFSFTAPVEFTGTKTMEISVVGAAFRLTFLTANYKPVMPGLDTNNNITGSENYFGDFYYNIVDSVVIMDPISNVTINDVVQSPVRDATRQEGNWMWIIPDNSTLSCNINIMAGLIKV